MDEAERDSPSFAVDATIPGLSLEESRHGLSSGLYLDESLEKGLGICDASSILYYGLNFDIGGLDLSTCREGEEVSEVRSLDKIPSEVGAAVDLFSASGLSNAYEDLSWDYDFSKKFPDLDTEFCEESNSWNSSLVSQSSGSSSKAVGVTKLSNQILECQDNQPEELISCDLDGSYMTSFVWDMLMNDEMGLKSSYSNELSYNNDVKTITSPVDTSESCHCSNEGYVGTPHELNHVTSSGTSFSLSMQYYDDSIVDEGMEADNPSLQAGSLNEHIYSCDLQEFSQVSPMDTSEYGNHSAEGNFGTSHSLNHLAARHTILPEQCSDAYIVDENSNADDPSLLGLMPNNPAFSFPQEFTEVSPMDTTESFPCSNEGDIFSCHDLKESKEGYTGASHDLKHPSPSCTSLSMQCCSAGMVDESMAADEPSPAFQGVLIRKHVRSCDPHRIGEVKNIDRPVEISKSGESYHHTNKEYFGTGLELNHVGPLSTSLPMQYSDVSLEDRDTEVEPITLQGAAAIKASDTCDLQNIGQVNIVAYPMKTRKFYHRRKKGNCGSSIDRNPQGASSFTSMFMKYSDANLVDGETEAVGPSLQGHINSKPAELCDPHGIDEHNSVAISVDAGEARQFIIDGCTATSNDLDLMSQGISCDPISEQGCVASPLVKHTEEDDPTLQSILIDERAKCRKVGQCIRRKKVQKQPILRCSNDSPTLKISCERRKKEETAKSSKRNHIELQKTRQPKRRDDTASAARSVVSRRCSKQDLDSESSDEEYDIFRSNMNLKTKRSMKQSDGRKNIKTRTSCESNLKVQNPKQSDRRKNNKLWTLSEVIKLVDGISEFGVGSWTPIRQAHFRSSPYRTSLDIRDKWRNLIKTSAARLKYLKEGKLSPKTCSINMPMSLLERIFELDRAHPYQKK